jgi:hypothetical protein
MNSRLCSCKAGALPLEPHTQFFLLWLFWKSGRETYLFQLASNCDPPDFSLPNSWDYRREAPAPGSTTELNACVWWVLVAA